MQLLVNFASCLLTLANDGSFFRTDQKRGGRAQKRSDWAHSKLKHIFYLLDILNITLIFVEPHKESIRVWRGQKQGWQWKKVNTSKKWCFFITSLKLKLFLIYREAALRAFQKERQKRREKEEFAREKLRDAIRQKYGIERKSDSSDSNSGTPKKTQVSIDYWQKKAIFLGQPFRF